jgi:hypothetical protein
VKNFEGWWTSGAKVAGSASSEMAARISGFMNRVGSLSTVGYLVAGFPGACVASMGHMALTHEGSMYDRAKRVLPVAVASVTGLFVAGVPGAIVAGLAVAGVTHKSNAIDIAKVTGDIRTGSLKADRANILANALEARGNVVGANAIRAEIATHKVTGKPMGRSTSRIPAVMRRAMGR